MYRDGTGQTRTDNQLTLLLSAESCYTVTSFYCFSSGVSTCAQVFFFTSFFSFSAVGTLVQPAFRRLSWSTSKSEQQQAFTKPKPKYSFSRIEILF